MIEAEKHVRAGRRASGSALRFAPSLAPGAMAEHVARQLGFFGARPAGPLRRMLKPHVTAAYERVRRCFSAIRKKYYRDGTRILFNHLHGDHYAAFLYLLANTVHRAGGCDAVAQQLFLLNKALHGLDLFYSVEMPEVFLLVHPVGTVLGNARYGNYLAVYQNCSVGSLETGGYPELGEEVVLFSRTALLGPCRVGRNVVFGANSFQLETDVPDDTVVVGAYPNHRFLTNGKRVRHRIFE